MMRNKGFTLLLALVVTGIVLTVGLGVFDIIIREIALSAMGRESQKAFYVADTGVECALYWDIKNGPISTTTPADIECANQTMSAGGSLISTFELTLPNGSCVQVIINKSVPSRTILEARGYNIDCASNDPKKVERGLRIAY